MMDKEALIDLVKKIIHAEGSEEEIDNLVELLERSVPHTGVTDLIFQAELSPEEIVERALNYRPIQL